MQDLMDYRRAAESYALSAPQRYMAVRPHLSIGAAK